MKTGFDIVRHITSALVAACILCTDVKAQTARQPVCATSDSAAAAAVRERLALWVRQSNSGDRQGAREVWVAGYTGWFPSAALFGDSAALAVAGLRREGQTQASRTTYDITIDGVVASGPIVVVHDLWTETREFKPSGAAVKRLIRGSELWRCQPDGRWRIARFVSAPEQWVLEAR